MSVAYTFLKTDPDALGRANVHGPGKGAWAGQRGMGRAKVHGPGKGAWAGQRCMGLPKVHGLLLCGNTRDRNKTEPGMKDKFLDERKREGERGSEREMA
eukprot:363618-Chlamydomonas_euryale.AAC.13